MKLFFLFCSILALWGGDAKSPAKPAVAATPAKSASDGEIERVFKAKLAKSKLAANNFQIRVNNGVATLEGTTHVVQHKGIATRMAKSSGAKSVVNQIKVSDTAKQKAVEQLSRRATVKKST